MKNFESNNEKYEAMSKPYTSEAEAQKANAAFHEGVKKLREKHRIAEMVCVTSLYFDKDGETFEAASSSQAGNFVVGIKLLDDCRQKYTFNLISELAEQIRDKNIQFSKTDSVKESPSVYQTSGD